MRAQRVMAQAMPSLMVSAAPTGKKTRQVFDARQTDQLPGVLVRSEGQAKVADKAVNEAFDHSGATYDFYDTLFSRNSLDNKGMTLVSSVHVAETDDSGQFVPMNNAFWNGEQMAYGDGDGVIFQRVHRIARRGRPRAHPRRRVVHQQPRIPESVRRPQRAFRRRLRGAGAAVEERREALKASWLVGAEVLVPAPTRRAIRDMENPGTAFVNDPDLGSDPQPRT